MHWVPLFSSLARLFAVNRTQISIKHWILLSYSHVTEFPFVLMSQFSYRYTAYWQAKSTPVNNKLHTICIGMTLLPFMFRLNLLSQTRDMTKTMTILVIKCKNIIITHARVHITHFLFSFNFKTTQTEREKSTSKQKIRHFNLCTNYYYEYITSSSIGYSIESQHCFSFLLFLFLEPMACLFIIYFFVCLVFYFIQYSLILIFMYEI